jgi:hypothetical protein
VSAREVTVRASSWADLFDCAYRWEGKHILNMRTASNGALALGTALHASTAVFDEARMLGKPVTPDDAAGVLVDRLLHPDEEVDWGEDSITEAEHIGLRLHTKYCTEISPRYEYKSVELRPEPLKIEVPAANTVVKITGQLDRSRVRAESAGVSVSDMKSGKMAVGSDGRAVTKGHWIQLGLYELLVEHSLHQHIAGPAEIIGLQTTKAGRVGTAEVVNARRGLIGTPESPGLIEMAANMLSTGLFPPNPRSITCHPRYCVRWSTCAYHG